MRNTLIFDFEKQCEIFPIFKLLGEMVLKWQAGDISQAARAGLLNQQHVAELPGVLSKAFQMLGPQLGNFKATSLKNFL